jgi:hypothetical protein
MGVMLLVQMQERVTAEKHLGARPNWVAETRFFASGIRMTISLCQCAKNDTREPLLH